MKEYDFHEEFDYFVDQVDVENANRVLMEELGRSLVHYKRDFVDLLNESGLYVTMDMSDRELVDIFINEIPHNQNLKVGAALLVNVHNKTIGFGGDDEINDEAVKDAYAVLYSYFDDVVEVDREYTYSNQDGGGGLFGGMFKGITDVVGKGADIGKSVYQDRRRTKHGASDEFFRQQEAKRQMIQSVMEQRRQQQEIQKQQIEARRKTTRNVLIVGGSVIALGLVVGLIYVLKKKK